ncbi:MAG: bi-domain-containing oxidoreductase [Anaerolineales bacterium]|nr:bi-domain-containing oxidoreductase [Anaerolineales bacterium]
MLVEFGQANLLAKARSQPERVRQVVDKMRTDGLLPTLEAVFTRLDQPLPLGYCNAGVVLAVGEGVNGFIVGDRVVSNGPHAEVVSVPQNLCARIPEGVSDDAAAFTVLAAIGLQGIRLAEPTLGEKVVVQGLGLIGLLATQMLVANGCQVLGVDFNTERLALAQKFGAQPVNLSDGGDPVAAALAFSGGRGADAVLITATTKSSEPVHQAAQMCRKRGRIVLVGVTGLELSRADFYEKELSFQVSCSYGPGRYDETYEQKGQDYPYGFVRWTEQRNFEAVLDLLASGRMNVEPLISHCVPQVEAPRAYQLLTDDPQALGILLTYPEAEPVLQRSVATPGAMKSVTTAGPGQAAAGVIGAGNFATVVLLPALAKSGAALQVVASSNGTSAAVAARKFGFAEATSDPRALLENPAVNTVFILTRHNTHGRFTVAALEAGKHVFVEKPLALNREELAQVEAAAAAHPEQQLLVGFNRRFAPLAQQMKQLLQGRVEPLSIIYTVNAGMIPANHWTQDLTVGGGRIIGEACHFIDFLRFLVGQPIAGVRAHMMGRAPGAAVPEDKMSICLDFADGSMGTVHYLANGSKQFPKERVEVFSQGRILALDNFRTLQGYGWSGLGKKRLWRQDKGHQAEVNAFVARTQQGGEWLIPWAELKEVTLATFVAVEQAALAGAELK